VIFCCSPTGVLRAEHTNVGGGLARVSTTSPWACVLEVDDLGVLGDSVLPSRVELGLLEGRKM
jgi:hypothetical protein